MRTCFRRFDMTLLWKLWKFVMAAPLSFAPYVMALATVAAHCSVPSVATGRSTLPESAFTLAAKAASATAAITAFLQPRTGQAQAAIMRCIRQVDSVIFGVQIVGYNPFPFWT